MIDKRILILPSARHDQDTRTASQLLNKRFDSVERLIFLATAVLAVFPLYQWYAEADSRAIDRRVNLVSAMATCGSGIDYRRESVLVESGEQTVRDYERDYGEYPERFGGIFADMGNRVFADIFIEVTLSRANMDKRTPVGVIAAEYLCAELEANILAEPSFQDFLRREIDRVRDAVEKQGDGLEVNLGGMSYPLSPEAVMERLEMIERMTVTE